MRATHVHFFGEEDGGLQAQFVLLLSQKHHHSQTFLENLLIQNDDNIRALGPKLIIYLPEHKHCINKTSA